MRIAATKIRIFVAFIAFNKSFKIVDLINSVEGVLKIKDLGKIISKFLKIEYSQ